MFFFIFVPGDCRREDFPERISNWPSWIIFHVSLIPKRSSTPFFFFFFYGRLQKPRSSGSASHADSKNMCILSVCSDFNEL